MTEVIWRLYPDFVEAGYSPLLFWDLSLGEVIDCVEGYKSRIERELKQREASVHDEIYMLYIQALQFGNILSCMIDNKKQINGLEVYYPELFNKEDNIGNFAEQEEEAGDKSQLTPEMESYKADMDDFVFRHNLAIAKRRGENSERNNTGKATGNHRGSD